jgi:hypothetical protein
MAISDIDAIVVSLKGMRPLEESARAVLPGGSAENNSL